MKAVKYSQIFTNIKTSKNTGYYFSFIFWNNEAQVTAQHQLLLIIVL